MFHNVFRKKKKKKKHQGVLCASYCFCQAKHLELRVLSFKVHFLQHYIVLPNENGLESTCAGLEQLMLNRTHLYYGQVLQDIYLTDLGHR